MSDHHEVFEKNEGFRLHFGERSIRLQATSTGERLSTREKASFALHGGIFLDSVGGIAPLRRASRAIQPHEISSVENPTFFKFATDEALEFLMKGHFQLGTPAYYRELPDVGRNDPREAQAWVFLEDEKSCVSLAGITGFNCGIFCGVGALPRDKRTLRDMRKEFGANIVNVDNPLRFAEALRIGFGAQRATFHDVVYRDAKHMSLPWPEATEFRNFVKAALPEDRLHDLNVRYGEAMYDALLLPSLCAKPASFAYQRERRLVLEFERDIQTPFLRAEIADAREFLMLR